MRLPKILLALAPVALLLTAFTPPEPKRPIELQRYKGLWFEVARLHNKFEDGCLRSDANYVPRQDGGFNVVQTCHLEGGKTKVWRSDMKVLDPGMNAKFRLTFFPFVYKDYWVLDADPNHSWVILGEPAGRWLWLFSRKPDLETDKAALVGHAKALGYDTSKLIYDAPG